MSRSLEKSSFSDENKINDILNYGWGCDLEKHNKTAINIIAESFLPFLVALAEKLQTETDTEYSYEELVNFGYIALVALILEKPNTIVDSGEIKDRTIGFLCKLIEAEAEVKDSIVDFECPEEDCLGKECRLRHCYAYTGDTSLKSIKKAQENHVKVKRPSRKVIPLKEETS